MEKARRKIEALLQLLDDDELSTVQSAMHELLKYGDELDAVLSEAQESSSPALRKHIHQLQAIRILRERRLNFFTLLNSSDLHLRQGLIELHLLWYDNDSPQMLEELFDGLVKEARSVHVNSLESLAHFGRSTKFQLVPDVPVAVEYYCLGPVIAGRMAALLPMLTLFKALGQELGLQLEVVRLLGHYALADLAAHKILLIQNKWQLLQVDEELRACEVWDDKALLKLLASDLFLLAVSSDSFRYIRTIAQSLTGREEGDPLDFLPYPYRTRE